VSCTSNMIKWSTYAKRSRSAPLIVLTWKPFFSSVEKKLDLNLNSSKSNNKKNKQQEADAARDVLAATSARDGPVFLELCDRLREQR